MHSDNFNKISSLKDKYYDLYWVDGSLFLQVEDQLNLGSDSGSNPGSNPGSNTGSDKANDKKAESVLWALAKEVELPQDEIAHALSLQRLEVRKKYLISKIFRRKILSEVFNIPLKNLFFEEGSWGKPKIKHYPDFNLSHAGPYFFWIVAKRLNDAVGIDIEKTKPMDFLNLAARFFHPKELEKLEQLADLDEKDFFQLWSFKEAFLKAMGQGIGYGLDKFAIEPRLGDWLVPDEWVSAQGLGVQLDKLKNLPAGYTGAACLIFPGAD